MLETALIVVFVIFLIYFLYTRLDLQFSTIDVPRLSIDEIKFKTGDLLLFKATNNFNALMLGSYYTHIGMVIIINDTPVIFEAQGMEDHYLPRRNNKRGIFLCNLKDRIKRYRGYVYHRPLNKAICAEQVGYLMDFINYALENMWYTSSVYATAIKKYMGAAACQSNTDCGQLVFLALIKMGLIDINEYHIPRLNHFEHMCGLTDLLLGFSYLSVSEISFPACRWWNSFAEYKE
jgi:hypothetical protein